MARTQATTKRLDKAGGEAVRAPIRTYRRSSDLILPKGVFAELVREITHNLWRESDNFSYTRGAFGALQEAAEIYLVEIIEDTLNLAKNANRETIQQKDMRLA